MRKKILQISTGVFQYDGLSKVILSLIDNCRSEDADNYVLLGKGAIPEYYLQLKQRNVTYFEGPDRELDVRNYSVFLFKLLKKHHFDVVHVHGNSATMALDLFIAKICRVPVRIAHSHNTFSKHPFIHNALKPLLGIVVTQPVACGTDAGKFLFNKPFVIIPNCIDVSKFEYNEQMRKVWREKLHLNGKFVVGHVGRFTYQKNHKLLINIFAEIYKHCQDSALLLIGEGELLQEVKEQVKSLGIESSVIFYGSADNVGELMQAMDVFVLPSVYEGLGIVAIEAQAAGIPTFLANTVPKESKKVEVCHYVNINAAPEAWWKKISRYRNWDTDQRQNGSQKIRDAGYDIKELPGVINKVWNLG